MRIALPLLLLFAHFAFNTSTASAQYHTMRYYIPSGFTILDRASADINRDGHADQVIVLRNPYEKMNGDTTRPLLLLAGNGKGGYHLMARNDSVAMCSNCGGPHGDPFEEVLAGRGWFSLKHVGGSSWRWTRVIRFQYNSHRQQFILQSDSGSSWYADTPEQWTPVTNRPEDFGRVSFNHFSYDRVFQSE
jgi:hypothetical protein